MMSFVESCGSGFWYILLGALGSYAPGGWGFPVDIIGEESACQAGDARDLGLVPGLGRSPAVGNGNPLQYSCLENSMNRRAWQATVQWSHKELVMSELARNTHTHTHTHTHTLIAWSFFGPEFSTN